MILIGTMDWASTRMRGVFACPTCGSSEQFRLRLSRPFLTLYFIPVLPIGGLQEFVQCMRCKSAFETEILTTRMMATKATPPSPPVSEGQPSSIVAFEEDVLKVISLMMIEDGQVTEDEIRVARRLYENMTQQNLSRDELGRMCSHVRLQRLTTSSFLATARNRRNHEEKLLLVQAMFGLAGADGEITPGRLQSLVKAQQLLGLDEAEFQRAIADTEQWLT
jgi:uncharacterized tellurite resistance protein B-like protein